jgi:hypothetical protein
MAVNDDFQILIEETLRTRPRRATIGGIVIHVSDLQVRVEVGTDVGYVATVVESLRSRC